MGDIGRFIANPFGEALDSLGMNDTWQNVFNPLGSAGERLVDDVEQGYDDNGFMGALGGLAGGMFAETGAGILPGAGAFLDGDDRDMIKDAADPGNIFGIGYDTNSAKREASELARQERLEAERILANSNILGVQNNIAKRRRAAGGAGNSIFGGKDQESIYKSLLGV